MVFSDSCPRPSDANVMSTKAPATMASAIATYAL